MKIRTRLLLFLLPALLGPIALIGTLIVNGWIPSHALYLIIAIVLFTTVLTVAAILFLSGKISDPIHKLNNSALAVAAGQYGELASVAGPKEISDLANTLNTMSQCLLENINRLKENSLLRERMYGEYECAMLLQHLMLQKNIDDCRSDALAIKSLTLFSDSPRGFLLDFPKLEQHHQFQIHLAEASSTGFEGMYHLLTQYKHAKDFNLQTTILLDRPTKTLRFHGSHRPLLWSDEQKRFIEPKENAYFIDSGDLFFVFNEGLLSFFKETKVIQEILTKVLKIFAIDGVETVASMLQKEFAFATKRKELSEDIHLLCFQILNT